MIEIITPAASSALTTLDAVKAELGISGADQDTRLTALIDQQSAIIASYCSRRFPLETIRETVYEPRPTDGLMLSRWPIVAVSSVTIDGAAVDAGGYLIEAESGILRRRSPTRCGLAWPHGETVVEYQAGYVLPGATGRTLPADIERACILAVKTAQFGTARDPALRSEQTDGVATFAYFQIAGEHGLPLEVQGLLCGYVSPAVA